MNGKSYKTDNKSNQIVLIVVIAMTFMATLDSSIVNVALPVLSQQLSVPISSIEWVAASYSMIICSTILFFGRLGDIIGKSRIFHIGTILFTLASLLCGLSTSFAMLIACRFLQGIGASAYMANNHGIITELFPRESRGKALGILVTAVAIGNMVGPSVGGMILSVFHWNYIFYVNVPFGMIVFLLGIKFLPRGRKKQEKLDIAGSILQFMTTLLFFGSLILSQQISIFHPYITAGITASIILGIIFIYVEKKKNEPLLDVKIFKSIKFSANLGCALTSFICIASSSILIPFYLQNALGLSPFCAGLFMMLPPLILAVCSPVFGDISDKRNPEKVIFVGLLILSLGFFLMSQLTETSSVIFFAVFVSTMAAGQAIFQTANNALIMSTCPKSKLGIVGSVNSLVRNLGQTVGITLSTTLLYSFMGNKAGYKVTDYIAGRDDVFIYGMRHVYLILVAICLIGACLTGGQITFKSSWQAKFRITRSQINYSVKAQTAP